MLNGLDILLPRCLLSLFTLAPFTTARGQTQPKCHSTGKEEVKMQYIDPVTTVKKMKFATDGWDQKLLDSMM